MTNSSRWLSALLQASTILLLGIVPLGCNGTRLGERISGSFDTPSPNFSGDDKDTVGVLLPLKAVAAGNSSTAYATAPISTNSTTQSDGNGVDEEVLKLGPALAGNQDHDKETPAIIFDNSEFSTSAQDAQAYRITLMISGANPSAPVKTLTQALLQAEVRFAIERIERVIEPAFRMQGYEQMP